MLFVDYADVTGRFALRELGKDDAEGLEFINKVLFFPYLRHVTGPRKLLEEAITAQSSEPRAFYCIGIVLPGDRTRLIGFIGAILTSAANGLILLKSVTQSFRNFRNVASQSRRFELSSPTL